ncbi:MAG: type II secretion system GspH family protein [Oscillospiraceae bacterium]|jgi:prepilin-type N-terminal cleavage/methylation domain-containing protein|nr:type II secretion system GspH family protein [Oscillospiraceae bacterium]
MTDFRRFRKIGSKSGFTLIELMVVITIVGVLLAIVVPALLSGNRASRAANERARDFYFTAQGVMADVRLSRNDDIKITQPPPLTQNIVFIEVIKTGTTVNPENLLRPLRGQLNIIDGDVEADFAVFVLGKLQTYLQGTNESQEFYYFTVDEHYRVGAVFTSTAQVGNAGDLDSYTLTASNRVDSIMVGVFPTERAHTNTDMTEFDMG